MPFLDKRIEVRITPNTNLLISDLLAKFPNRYQSNSDVLRVAIIKLYRHEVPEGALRPEYEE